MKKVTVRMLDSINACEEDVSLFILYFGKDAEVTLDNCLACKDLGLDLQWFAIRVLSATALAEYYMAISPAWDAWEKAQAPAWDAYHKATDQEWVEFYKAKAMAWDKYDKAVALALYDALKGE